MSNLTLRTKYLVGQRPKPLHDNIINHYIIHCLLQVFLPAVTRRRWLITVDPRHLEALLVPVGLVAAVSSVGPALGKVELDPLAVVVR